MRVSERLAYVQFAYVLKFRENLFSRARTDLTWNLLVTTMCETTREPHDPKRYSQNPIPRLDTRLDTRAETQMDLTIRPSNGVELMPKNPQLLGQRDCNSENRGEYRTGIRCLRSDPQTSPPPGM